MLDLSKQPDDTPYECGAHTPGPWAEFCESGDWWIQQTDAEGNPIGDVICESNDITSANVDLICAAPDLLAALQRYVDSDDCEFGDGDPCPGDIAMPICRWHQARAAIAKARAD